MSLTTQLVATEIKHSEIGELTQTRRDIAYNRSDTVVYTPRRISTSKVCLQYCNTGDVKQHRNQSPNLKSGRTMYLTTQVIIEKTNLNEIG